MKNKKPTITIGIPAYNEEANIQYLLEDIFKQNMSGFIMEKIIVASDASSDNTVHILKKHKNKVEIIQNKKRLGVAKTQNRIFQYTNSGILILLNADIMIKDKDFFKKLIQPIKEGAAELASSEMEELNSPTFIGSVLNISMKFKKSVFRKYKKGQNIYTCKGTVRAFSKDLYKKLIFVDSIGEDAYSYLFTIFHNYRYAFINSAKAYYRMPTNFKDHEKQSLRFLQSKKKYTDLFGKKFVDDNYFIPGSLLIKEASIFLLKYPVQMILYIFIYLTLRCKSIFVSNINEKWDMSGSSKILRIY